MASRKTLLSLVFFVILFVFTEVLLRLVLVFYGYPFFSPSDYIFKGYYKDLEDVVEKDIRNDDDIKDVLILGGSVISTPWSGMEARLDSILKKHSNGDEKFAFYNVAAAGHTSLDNKLKYEMLHKQRFDLVIYYEAINENRANNIPKEHFRVDYSHMRWYNDIGLLQSHPEINFTVIPFITDLIVSKLRDKFNRKVYISYEEVDPSFTKYGNEIKTTASYQKNIDQIIHLAKERGEELLLMSYASYFPENYQLTGKQQDMEYFAGCYYASHVNIWGAPDNIKKGIAVHNEIIQKLALRNNVNFMDMANIMPKNCLFFCDVCHVSEAGAQYFAHQLSSFIVDQNLLR